MRNQQGYSLVEIVLVIIILGITIPPLLNLFSYNLTNSSESEYSTRALYFAEERMEEILGDKRASDAGKGFGYILAPGRYPDDEPATGFTRHVTIDTAGKRVNGIPYAEVRVVVRHAEIDSIVLTGWVTDYD